MEELSQAAFRRHMRLLSIPDGFTGRFESKPGWRSKELLVFILQKPEDTIITFDQTGSGHTTFKIEGGWRSFDRTGVEDSFYHLPMFDRQAVKDLNTIVAEQLTKIAERREYYKTAVNIPEIGFTVAPTGVQKLKDDLKKSGRLSFMPSGFGTGYFVTKKPTRACQYGEKRASPELETFFGHTPLYVSTFDAD